MSIISINRSFNLFIFASMLGISLCLMGFLWLKVSQRSEQQHRSQIQYSAQQQLLLINQYTQSRINELLSQMQSPLLKQALAVQSPLQSDKLKQFFKNSYVQRQQHQQVLYDLTGAILYQRFATPTPFGQVTKNLDFTKNHTMQLSQDFKSINILIPVTNQQQIIAILLTQLPIYELKHYLSKLTPPLTYILEVLQQKQQQPVIRFFELNNIEHVTTLKLNERLFGLPTQIQYSNEVDRTQNLKFIEQLFYLLMLATVIISLLAIALAKRFFIHPIQRLNAHSLQMAQGGTQLIPLPSFTTKELLDVTKSFNTMVTLVSKRESELQQALTQLKQQQAQLLQSDKMASIGLLSAGIAHEINNPVGFISSNLQTLVQYLHPIEAYYHQTKSLMDSENHPQKNSKKLQFIFSDLQELTQDCQEGLSRIKGIVSDLKQFSRQDNSDIQKFYLEACIQQTLKFVHHEIKYKCQVQVQILDPCLIEGHGNQINQVLINLIMNAQQSIENEGRIDIMLQQKQAWAELSITDTGCGIKQDDLNRLFDPFFTTKEVGKGTGLGLSISYDIIKKHGGSIQVQSTPQIGTQFTIRLPILKESD